MDSTDFIPSTGLPSLDRMLHGLHPGDNVVWRVDSIEDYAAFVDPFVRNAIAEGRSLVYFRYAKHRPLIPPGPGVQIQQLYPERSFETLITSMHRTIERVGRHGFYVFDSLSELSYDCYSDRMTGCFFMLTCPFLYELDTIAYFAIRRNYHSFHAASPIERTPQVLLDVYRHKDRLFVHPLKVQERFSPTMYMLHERREDDTFTPVTESATTSEVLTSVTWPGNDVNYLMGVWSRNFIQAESLLDQYRRGECTRERVDETFDRLLRMVIATDERVLRLARKYLTLDDILIVRKRMIGSGMIGGKATGILLARAILRAASQKWNDLLESHDSFFIGSEVFYEFLVRNGCWRLRQSQKDNTRFMEGLEEARRRILNGTFPDYIRERFEHMLSYFGQSPIIVRSSSLLEDNFGNAFPGKYESVFCTNQGTLPDRLDRFMAAVKEIYASTMSEKALMYRSQRGILDRDEQMAIVVQRVSGAPYANLFLPQAAGVGFSFNPYVWSEEIDPNAGVLRLVMGLGTRAVDPFDDDYTRLVALNAPAKRPEAAGRDVRRYSQRYIDAIDLRSNEFRTLSVDEMLREAAGFPMGAFASKDEEIEQYAAERGLSHLSPWVLTFDPLLQGTSFTADMSEMLAVLQEAYAYPVDIEFTVNFFGETGYRINLLQCRPFQVKGGGVISDPPSDLSPSRIVFESRGVVIGRSMANAIDRIIYVSPHHYGQLPLADRYSVARLIGRISHMDTPSPLCMALLGPGRWGTSTPHLGVPVQFPEINTVSILGEIVAMREDMVPDVSLGTHFFSNLVESDILYIALFPKREGNVLNTAFFDRQPNRLAELMPEEKRWSDVIRIIDTPANGAGSFVLNANALKQHAICYTNPA